MTERQNEVLNQITERWKEKSKGTYVDRKISKTVYALMEMGHVEIHPYVHEFGNMAFPTRK